MTKFRTVKTAGVTGLRKVVTESLFLKTAIQSTIKIKKIKDHKPWSYTSIALH